MKCVILLGFIAFMHQSVCAQRILFKERSANGATTERFGKYVDGVVQFSYCPLNVVQYSTHNSFTSMSQWTSSPSGAIYWTNGFAIYKYDFELGRNQLVIDKLFRVTQLVATDKHIYIVSHPDQSLDALSSRYAKGQKLLRINTTTGKREQISVPDWVNFANLSISADENTISFIHTINHDDESLQEQQFCLYNLVSKKVSIIDQGQFTNNEHFGISQMQNSSVWLDSNRLLYYKCEGGKASGTIFYYDINNKTHIAWLKSIDDKNITGFSYSNRWFYFFDGQKVYKTKDGINREVMVEWGAQEAFLVKQ
ncbi:hypothetical protein [Solitalea lacus]|uniref:hypothetical protein n=1 Tax=Solitalea lacus TaxID=2911172 RepID=UPI001EDBF0DA|nr:hypothetical protein [Solitalea lacus]UKJ08688.1 hypothetical protein L2B55_05845 [Solitalea lacus]